MLSYKVTKLQYFKKLQKGQVTKLQSYKSDSKMIKNIDYNTCYYSPGTDKHSCCTHLHYCIFNKNRINLENQINNLSNDLHTHIQSWTALKTGKNYTNADYKETKEAIKLLNNDLNRLREFEKKIKNKEVTGYGYQ